MKSELTFFSKIMLVVYLSALFLNVSSAATETRTFYSNDKSKSFDGKLLAFDSDTDKVRVRTSQGKELSFSLNKLSKECQEYVNENASKVAVASALGITFEQVKGEKKKGSSSTDYTYKVDLHNRSKTALKDLDIEYAIYYKKDTIKKGEKATEHTETGSFNTYRLDAGYRIEETTDLVSITRKTIKATGGG